MARGKVLRGSFTSSLMAQSSSMPVKANAILDQKLSLSIFGGQSGKADFQEKCVTLPRCNTRYVPMPTSISKGTYVETPPAFCSHLPMFRPTKLKPTATARRPKEAQSRYFGLAASQAYFAPPM